MSNPVCFFDMSIGGEPAGRIEMTVSPPLFPCPRPVPCVARSANISDPRSGKILRSDATATRVAAPRGC